MLYVIYVYLLYILYSIYYRVSFSVCWTTKFGDLDFFAPDLVFWPLYIYIFPFIYYVIYSLCGIIHLIVLGCVFVAWFSKISFFILFYKNQGPRPCIWSRTLVNKVPDLVLGIFVTYHFLLTLISADMSNASIMHTIVFLNILKAYLGTFFHSFTIKKK